MSAFAAYIPKRTRKYKKSLKSKNINNDIKFNLTIDKYVDNTKNSDLKVIKKKLEKEFASFINKSKKLDNKGTSFKDINILNTYDQSIIDFIHNNNNTSSLSNPFKSKQTKSQKEMHFQTDMLC